MNFIWKQMFQSNQWQQQQQQQKQWRRHRRIKRWWLNSWFAPNANTFKCFYQIQLHELPSELFYFLSMFDAVFSYSSLAWMPASVYLVACSSSRPQNSIFQKQIDLQPNHLAGSDTLIQFEWYFRINDRKIRDEKNNVSLALNNIFNRHTNTYYIIGKSKSFNTTFYCINTRVEHRFRIWYIYFFFRDEWWMMNVI